MDEELLATHVEELHGLDRGEFTAERNRRAKQLRADGHRDEAAALQSHRKPTVTAWTVNQLARRSPDRVGELLGVAEELQGTQRRAASGRGGDGLREGSRRLRELVDELRAEAREILEEADARPEAHLDEVAQTVQAAAVDPDHHDALRRGILETALQASGFGGVEMLLAVDDADAPGEDGETRTGGRSARGKAAGGGGGKQRPAVGRRSRAAEGRASDREPDRERDREERREREEARRERERKRRKLQRRRDELDDARAEQRRDLEEHEAELDALRRRLAEVEDAADRRRDDLDRTDDELRAVAEELADLGE